MPAEYVDAFLSFFVDGTLDESEVLPTVESVLGPAAAELRRSGRGRTPDRFGTAAG
jgi:hypothetical protein